MNQMSHFLLYPFILAFLLFLVYQFWFLRNPKRKIPFGNNIVSPADGRIVKIIKYDHDKTLEIQENKLGKIFVKTKDVAPRGWLIVIMMNIHNMHRQKAPLSGEVLSIKYSKGNFFNAVRKAHNLRASLENENNEILIKTAIGNIKVIQVAGVMAKKIVCAVEEGQKVFKGDPLGLIKLGSQVILVLPEDNIELKVKEKDKVKAGSGIIAEIKTLDRGIFEW